jgi:hypothetical protein
MKEKGSGFAIVMLCIVIFFGLYACEICSKIDRVYKMVNRIESELLKK